MEVSISGVCPPALTLAPRRRLRATPPHRTATPRSTRDSSVITAMGDLRRTKEIRAAGLGASGEGTCPRIGVRVYVLFIALFWRVEPVGCNPVIPTYGKIRCV
jgi:hypothetical protein